MNSHHNFAVFILTHGRPNNVLTVKTLERCGYTGPIYFIVDNEDQTVNQYCENFGVDRVIVFDKKAEANRCDEGNNFDERRTITMARNASFGIAEQLGITYFLQLDDDYRDFRFRFDNPNGHYWVVKDLDRTFSIFLDFYKSIPAKSIAFSQGGDHIGGFKVTKLKRKAMNSFFCSTERPFKFVGSMNEDVNTYVTLGSRGDLFFTFMSLQLDQIETQARAGGITDMYKRFGTYCKAFTTVMMAPSSVKVYMMSTKNQRLHHAISWPKTVPCILHERHRKKSLYSSATPALPVKL